MAKASQKTIELGGKKYVLQKVKPSQWLKILDNRDMGLGKISRETFYKDVLESIVVQPQVTMDDFEDYSELEELVAEAIRFQQG